MTRLFSPAPQRSVMSMFTFYVKYEVKWAMLKSESKCEIKTGEGFLDWGAVE